MIVQILKNDEIIREIDEESETILHRAKLDAEVMSRDLPGDYSARKKPEEVEEIPIEKIPDEPA